MTSSRAGIAVRGVAAAALATFVALLSHVAGGGDPPGIIGLAAPLILSAFVCVGLAGRKLSLLRLAIGVAISQFLFHALFVLGAPRSSNSGALAQPHHAHALAPGWDVSGAQSVHLVQTSSDMWVAHALACALTVIALHRAETVLASLAKLAQLLLARIIPAAPIAALCTPPATGDTVPPRVDVPTLPIGVYASVTAHRGPPALGPFS